MFSPVLDRRSFLDEKQSIFKWRGWVGKTTPKKKQKRLWSNPDLGWWRISLESQEGAFWTVSPFRLPSVYNEDLGAVGGVCLEDDISSLRLDEDGEHPPMILRTDWTSTCDFHSQSWERQPDASWRTCVDAAADFGLNQECDPQRRQDFPPK